MTIGDPVKAIRVEVELLLEVLMRDLDHFLLDRLAPLNTLISRHKYKFVWEETHDQEVEGLNTSTRN